MKIIITIQHKFLRVCCVYFLSPNTKLGNASTCTSKQHDYLYVRGKERKPSKYYIHIDAKYFTHKQYASVI